MESFKVWYAAHFGKNLPKGKEIMELMNQRFGIYNKGWHNIEMYIEEEDAMDDA
jgi:hypothetical protein